jgi:orotate phosphoribosyltransferase
LVKELGVLDYNVFMQSTNLLINTLINTNKDFLLDRLLAILAKQSYIEGKITLASGKESNYYVDCKQTTLHHEGNTLISYIFSKMLKPGIQAVGGLTMGADPLASGVSQMVYLLEGKPLDAFYVRKEPKKHGRSLWIEGPIKPGSKVTILEDVVTTGGSSIKAIERVQEFGCVVEQVLAIVDRNEGGRETFKSKGIDYSYIFDINEVIKKASQP